MGEVAMGVDERRHQRAALQIDALGLGVYLGFHLFQWPAADDLALLDQYGLYIERVGHGQDRAAIV